MKNYKTVIALAITFLLVFALAISTMGQTTISCKDTIEHKTRMVLVAQGYDSTYQKCDTIKSSPLFNGMYVSGADAKMADPLKKAILLSYCTQTKVNFLALYSMGNVWGNVAKENYTSAFIKEAHAIGIKVAPVFANKSEVMAADAFNKKYTNDFDWLLREKEVWNMAVADQPAGIVTDSITAMAEKSVSISNALLGYGTYIGWSVQNGRYFKMVTVTSSAIFIHVYRTNPLDWGYAKPRIIELQNDCAALGVNLPVVVIISYEPGFSQNWSKTNTLSKIDDYFKPLIDPYPNLFYWGKLSFTDNFQMISIPYKVPLTGRAIQVTFAEDEFVNETTPSHRQYLPLIKRLNLFNKKKFKQVTIPVDTVIVKTLQE